MKPKALVFPSPLKSPPKKSINTPADNMIFSTASTKVQTASSGQGRGGHDGRTAPGSAFGLSNCMFKCEVNEQDGSPEVMQFNQDTDNGKVQTAMGFDLLRDKSIQIMNENNMKVNIEVECLETDSEEKNKVNDENIQNN